jgi:hypothetical protein
MAGDGGAATGAAGVGAPVGGCEARAEADAWGVGAADITYQVQEETGSIGSFLVLSLSARDDARV